MVRGHAADGPLLLPASRRLWRVSASDGCLSVVMPCYNEVATVDEIVSRVLAGRFTGELIVVDDGSTDGTRDRLSMRGTRL